MVKISNNINSKGVSFKSLNIGAKGIKALEFACDKISSPEQRLVIGATALLIQPVIDLTNKKVDKRTKETSAARSIGRAIVGTATGYAVRALTIKGAEALSEAGKLFDTKSLAKATKAQKNNYINTIGTILGLLVMLFTNFLIDIPGINAVQDIVAKKVFKHEPKHSKEETAKSQTQQPKPDIQGGQK